MTLAPGSPCNWFHARRLSFQTCKAHDYSPGRRFSSCGSSPNRPWSLPAHSVLQGFFFCHLLCATYFPDLLFLQTTYKAFWTPLDILRKWMNYVLIQSKLHLDIDQNNTFHELEMAEGPIIIFDIPVLKSPVVLGQVSVFNNIKEYKIISKNIWPCPEDLAV